MNAQLLLVALVLLAGYSAVEGTNVIEEISEEGSIEDSGNARCLICEFVMQHIQEHLKDSRSDDAIERTVNNICDVVPTSIWEECDDFVSEHGDVIKQMLMEDTSLDEICRMVQYCQDTEKMGVFECGVCEVAVFAMKELLDNPKIDHSVVNILQKTCKIVPRRKRGKCQDVIGKYGSKIYDALVHYVKKTEVCKRIGAC